MDVSGRALTDSTHLVSVSGEADLHTAPELKAALVEAIDAGAAVLVVDLSGTTFIDSSALGVLIGALKRVSPKGGRVALVVPDPNVRRIFELTLLDRVFDLHDTRVAALEQAGLLAPPG